MVNPTSPTIATLTSCTILQLYHDDLSASNSVNPSIACSLLNRFEISLLKWFRRFFLFSSPMALATSLRLSTPLPTITHDEPATDVNTTESISNASMTSVHLNKLYKYSQETELKSYVDPTGTIRQYRQSTERALLAQRKIFLRKKLGEGSFSSVREGFDFCHQYKVAIKVSWQIDGSKSQMIEKSFFGQVVDTQRASKDFQEKFLPRELDIWPRVQHANIIKMYDHFIECGKIFMVYRRFD